MAAIGTDLVSSSAGGLNPGIRGPASANVEDVANPHFNRREGSPVSPLADAQEYPFTEKFEEGKRLLDESKFSEARELFSEIQDHFKEELIGEQAVIPGLCKLSIALSHPLGSVDRVMCTFESKEEADQLFDQRALLWNGLSKEKKIKAYTALRWSYEKLCILIPQAVEEILPKIAECSSVIDSLSSEKTVKKSKRVCFEDEKINCREKLLEAHNLLSAGKSNEARALYQKIQGKLQEELKEQGKDLNSGLLSSCMLRIASTYPPDSTDSTERTELIAKAQEITERLFNSRASWDACLKEEKKSLYTELLGNYTLLLELIPESTARDTLNHQIQVCRDAIKGLAVRITQSNKPKRVTDDPMEWSSRIGKIFAIALVSLVVVVAASFTYKRFFVKK